MLIRTRVGCCDAGDPGGQEDAVENAEEDYCVHEEGNAGEKFREEGDAGQGRRSGEGTGRKDRERERETGDLWGFVPRFRTGRDHHVVKSPIWNSFIASISLDIHLSLFMRIMCDGTLQHGSHFGNAGRGPFPAPPTLTPLFPSRFFAVELHGRLDGPQERYSY